MIDHATELLGWYDREQRDLPWRRPGVDAVADPGQRVHAAADAGRPGASRSGWTGWRAGRHRRRPPPPSAADVLRAWGKLGYPRRAKRLHECAMVIATEYDDVVPDDVETLLTLPGVGAYTARAIACFAYRQRVPVVDTNVRRVVARAVHGRGRRGRASSTA